MKRILSILVMTVLSIGICHAQKITDSSYRSVGYIKADGTVQDSSYRTIGHVKKDGTVQDSSYRTIGHAKDLPMEWAALYFFFKL